MIPKRWKLPTPEAADDLPMYSSVQGRILRARGLTTPDAAQAFLNGDWPASQDPFLMTGMHAAVGRLQQMPETHEDVVVYGDYDADGVTATALLVEALCRAGVRAGHYIPNRFDEGYGLSVEALSRLAAQGVRLVVTVDCGIRSVSEAEQAAGLGLELIVTDHHHPGAELPRALAVINPKQPGDAYPFKELSGAGLAYKLAQAVMRARGAPDPDDLLDLAAIGTVADLAPLVGENRRMVRQGLERLNRTSRPGVQELMRVSGIAPGGLRASGIGFGLAPRLNAAGRLDSPEAAYRLLVCVDRGEAKRLAEELDGANRERQQITRQMVEAARAQGAATDDGSGLIFAADPDFNEGVVGLAAARLVDEFYRPAIVARWGAEQTRASARSIPEFHITRALDECADLLLRYGGHAAAAGFTVRTRDLQALITRLRLIARRELPAEALAATLEIDAEVQLDELDGDLLAFIERLEPCGYGNPVPLLASRRVRISGQRAVGADRKHLKLMLAGAGRTMEAIAFRQGDRFGQLPETVDIAFHLERNAYLGYETLQLNVRDIQSPASVRA